MTLLLIVGHADDIFIVNMAKWLKKRLEIEIDVIAHNRTTNIQTGNHEYYHRVDYMPQRFLFDNIHGIRRFTLDWDRSRHLKNILNGRHYDIIHCHYIGGLYAGASYLKKYCDRLYFSFWGGERSNCRYLGSNYLYRAKLSQIIEKYADGLIGTDIRTAYIWKHHDKVPTYYYGTLGSSSMDFICDLVDNSSQNKSKDYYGISPEKVSVQIGYSGKEIHQQCEIIQALREHPDLKEKIHLVAPMTRGANKAFTEKVETALRESGFSYTLLKDRFLTDEEMAKLRFAQDVVFQLSTYDGYSRSIIECLSAGAIVIYGKWLNYDSKFAEDGFEGIGVDSIGEAVEQLAEIVKHPHNYTELRKLNQEKAKKKYLWAECIKDWVAVYNGTAQPLNEQE